MIILGLAGQAGAGKDTVADYLVERYGYVKFAFSDALYAEVQAAYGLEDQELLRNRDTKELPTYRLSFNNCNDRDFPLALGYDLGSGIGKKIDWYAAWSPRQILQLWGTEYRRAQAPDYWLKKCEAWLEDVRRAFPYPEQAPQYFVNTTCRFPNEQAWIRSGGADPGELHDNDTRRWAGQVWHIRRAGHGAINTHVSETELPVLDGERELYNNDTITRLYMGVDLLLGTAARFVRVEPMEDTSDAR